MFTRFFEINRNLNQYSKFSNLYKLKEKEITQYEIIQLVNSTFLLLQESMMLLELEFKHNLMDVDCVHVLMWS